MTFSGKFALRYFSTFCGITNLVSSVLFLGSASNTNAHSLAFVLFNAVDKGMSNISLNIILESIYSRLNSSILTVASTSCLQ